MGLVQSRIEEVLGAGAEVFGVGADNPFALKKWAEMEGFAAVPILSDTGRAAIGAYGITLEDLRGIKNVANRAVFIMDKAGNVAHKEVTPTPRDMPDVNGALDKLIELAK